MPRLQAASLKSLNSNPAGPGVLLANLVEFTPLAVKQVLGGDESLGLKLGALTAAPSVSITREITDRSEGIVGLNAPLLGAQVLQRTDISVEADLVELHTKNLKILHPGLTEVDWMSAAHARATIGTGNAAFNVAALRPGVSGNTIAFAVSAPSGSVTTVAVGGTNPSETITVAPATGATALDVIDAINGHAEAKKLVQAGTPLTSDGTGAVATHASAPLAGGSAGAKIGARLKPTGTIRRSDYMRNVVLALEGDNTDVLQLWRINNVIQTEDLDYEPDDEGGVSGMTVTFAGHVGDSDYDPNTGIYIPPYEILNLTTPSS